MIATHNLLENKKLAGAIGQEEVLLKNLKKEMAEFNQDAKALDYACQPEVLRS